MNEITGRAAVYVDRHGMHTVVVWEDRRQRRGMYLDKNGKLKLVPLFDNYYRTRREAIGILKKYYKVGDLEENSTIYYKDVFRISSR